jgi:hypothetical protein
MGQGLDVLEEFLHSVSLFLPLGITTTSPYYVDRVLRAVYGFA